MEPFRATIPEKVFHFEYTSDSESENGSAPVPVASTIWKGQYCLAFDIPPANPRRGWIVGGGSFGTTEIVLTEKRDTIISAPKIQNLLTIIPPGSIVFAREYRKTGVAVSIKILNRIWETGKVSSERLM